jgi:hypothetical protein
MSSYDSQFFEAYVPVYDAVPEKWEDARPFLVEHLKKISNAVNIREIGWLLDQEYLSGQSFIPGVIPTGNTTPAQFRSVLRTVINCSPLVAGLNQFSHNITVDVNFTLIQLWGAATNSVTFVAEPLPNGTDTLSINATKVLINTTAAWDRAYVVISYIQEL